MRTRVMNQLQAIAMNEGVRVRKKLWSKSGRAKLESLQLAPWAVVPPYLKQKGYTFPVLPVYSAGDAGRLCSAANLDR
jgi:hypothetical protein